MLLELLGTDAAEAAWNYCAPVVDYDALRKEVVTIFADRAAEVQGLVMKLQITQRAAEQALDRYLWMGGGRIKRLWTVAQLSGAGRGDRPAGRSARQLCKSAEPAKEPLSIIILR